MKVGDILFLSRACHLLISNKVCDLRKRIYERDIKNEKNHSITKISYSCGTLKRFFVEC